MNRQQRDTLLLGDRNSASGGGQPLPEAIRAVLAYLTDQGPAKTSTLHRIIVTQRIVEFKSKRILSVWGTWTDFTEAILGLLNDEGFIVQEEGVWSTTEKAVSGKQLTILRSKGTEDDRRIRVTFYSERERLARDEMQVTKNAVDSLLTQVQRVRNVHPVYEKIFQYQAACAQLLSEQLNGVQATDEGEDLPSVPAAPKRVGYNGPRRREPGVIKNWVYDYLTTHPREVISVKLLTDTFNGENAETIESGEYPAIHTGVVNQAINRLYMDHPGCQVEWIREGVKHVSVIYVPASE